MALPPGDGPRHFLHPCTIFAHHQEHWVSTILGSCIAVCLWDERRALGGINHFMLPLWNGEGLATPKYGNIAMEKLVERMRAYGCREPDLVAKVFGGASVIRGEAGATGIGERNFTVAKELLAARGIPLVASAVGGELGMKIHFNTMTGRVLMARLAGDPTQGGYPDGRPKTMEGTGLSR